MHFEGEASGMGETYYLRACPFCGTIPEVEEIPLWDGERGRKDQWKFDISCKCCGCSIIIRKNDTLTRDKETARRNAITVWNRRYETQ